MRYRKLNADCDDELMARVKKSAKIEKRTLANFIRLACTIRCNHILSTQREGDSQ